MDKFKHKLPDVVKNNVLDIDKVLHFKYREIRNPWEKTLTRDRTHTAIIIIITINGTKLTIVNKEAKRYRALTDCGESHDFYTISNK